jgi:peptidoglycan/xylan/chitin deacetylase (PgdA/CDA1 family)
VWKQSSVKTFAEKAGSPPAARDIEPSGSLLRLRAATFGDYDAFMLNIHSVLRNCLCGILACGVIASGRVRRARKTALAGGVVTSIYFHNPNRRLFARCIRWLIANGYVFISANDLVEILYHGKTPPKGAVWLSFDDGYKEWLRDVMPVVCEHKIPVTFFIPTGIVQNLGLFPWMHRGESAGKNSENGQGARDAMTLPELKQIASCPQVTVGGHTVNHTVTAQLNEESTRFELAESKSAIEEWTGEEVKCFSYPEGRFDGHERAVLEELGYKLAATTLDALITRYTDPYLVPRFCVSDNISFPEAICNMVGEWRPALDPYKRLVQP